MRRNFFSGVLLAPVLVFFSVSQAANKPSKAATSEAKSTAVESKHSVSENKDDDGNDEIVEDGAISSFNTGEFFAYDTITNGKRNLKPNIWGIYALDKFVRTDIDAMNHFTRYEDAVVLGNWILCPSMLMGISGIAVASKYPNWALMSAGVWVAGIFISHVFYQEARHEYWESINSYNKSLK